MAYQVGGTVIIDDSLNINTVGFVTSTSGEISGAGAIESGTVCYFFQATSPVGWTQITTNNDLTLRVVSGTGGGTGGSVGFATEGFATNSAVPISFDNVAGTTLTEPQLPSHTHAWAARATPTSHATNATSTISVKNTSNTGGNQPHDHGMSSIVSSSSLDLRIEYIDIIVAQRDA